MKTNAPCIPKFSALLPTHVPFSSEEGQKLFLEASHKNSFFILAPNFEAQKHPTVCGISAAVIAINTLEPNTRLTQDFILENHAAKIRPVESILGEVPGVEAGLKLFELRDMINSLGLNAKAEIFSPKESPSLEKFREDLKEVFDSGDSIAILNFDYKEILGTGPGHFSPAAAYHTASDRVLILDVARHKNVWFWIELKSLYRALQTKDGDTFRGYLRVSSKEHA